MTKEWWRKFDERLQGSHWFIFMEKKGRTKGSGKIFDQTCFGKSHHVVYGGPIRRGYSRSDRKESLRGYAYSVRRLSSIFAAVPSIGIIGYVAEQLSAK
ncbi:hypothetical protein V6N11_050853 [Hibiscus sabdariffa]|uniref:Uncharacterized protein n=2 Tax=Hibiscus sabdariffa TaxID=183260 RepID=A0ABR2TB70_9ROSI